MSDWVQPGLTDPYSNFLDSLKARDYDAISLGFGTITNPQAGMMRYVRASNKFQEYDGTIWVDKILSVAGGGTGSNTPGGAIGALGLGTMAIQNANAINVTGGQLTALSGVQINGAGSVNGRWDIGGGSYVAGSLEARAGLTVTGNISATTANIHGNMGVDGGITSGPINVVGNLACNRLDASQLILTYSDLYARGVLRAGPSDIPITNTDGTVLASRIGYGYSGAGNKVLLDNNTWGVLNVSSYISSIVDDASFGSGETTHDINISGLGLASVNELMFFHGGPHTIIGADGYAWDLAIQKPVSVNLIRLIKIAQNSAVAGPQFLGPSTHSFFAYRIRLG